MCGGSVGMRARRQARPSLSSFLFSGKPMGLAFHHFFPLRLPREQPGLLQRGPDLESALHHHPLSKVAWWEPGDKKWELTSPGQENRRLPSARVDKLHYKAFSLQRSTIDGFPRHPHPTPTLTPTPDLNVISVASRRSSLSMGSF